jgi:hypothetical protein
MGAQVDPRLEQSTSWCRQWSVTTSHIGSLGLRTGRFSVHDIILVFQKQAPTSPQKAAVSHKNQMKQKQKPSYVDWQSIWCYLGWAIIVQSHAVNKMGQVSVLCETGAS